MILFVKQNQYRPARLFVLDVSKICSKRIKHDGYYIKNEYVKLKDTRLQNGITYN